MATATMLEPAPALPMPVDDDGLYEIVKGQRVEKPFMGNREALIASGLLIDLGNHCRVHQLGRVVSEAMFVLDEVAGLNRRPDVSFFSYERWPKARELPPANTWEVVPELAVEVISPPNYAVDTIVKVHDYFRAGAKLVWLIYPEVRQVYAYDSPTSVRILGLGADLDGGPVLPGFKLSIASLFENAS